MNYFYLFLSILSAFVVYEVLKELWLYWIERRNAKKMEEVMERLKDKLVSNLADVDRVDDFAKEWNSE